MGKTIVFQGDSITDTGRCRQTREANTGLGSGYAYMTMAYLCYHEAEKNFRIYNRGTGGDRVVDLYARWKIDALNLKPDILSILVGVNDTWREAELQDGVEVERYEMIYRMMLEWTRRELPQVKLVLMEPFVLLTGSVNDKWLPEFTERQKIVKLLAEEFDAIFIPLQTLFNAAVQRVPDPAYWTVDGIHPTPQGHLMISEAWLNATKSIR